MSYYMFCYLNIYFLFYPYCYLIFHLQTPLILPKLLINPIPCQFFFFFLKTNQPSKNKRKPRNMYNLPILNTKMKNKIYSKIKMTGQTILDRRSTAIPMSSF